MGQIINSFFCLSLHSDQSLHNMFKNMKLIYYFLKNLYDFTHYITYLYKQSNILHHIVTVTNISLCTSTIINYKHQCLVRGVLSGKQPDLLYQVYCPMNNVNLLIAVSNSIHFIFASIQVPKSEIFKSTWGFNRFIQQTHPFCSLILINYNIIYFVTMYTYFTHLYMLPNIFLP